MQIMDKADDWKILKISSVNTEQIRKDVLAFYDEWLLDTSRQKTFTTHENTFMYELIHFDYAWRPGENQTSKMMNKLSNLAEQELSEIYKMLEDYVDGRVVHSEIISMKPNSRIRIHKDRGDMLYLVRRFHVPIKTNSKTFFTVEDENFFLEEKNLYELNNTKYHGVRNQSDEYRIHLIIDVMPNAFLEGIVFE